MKATQKLPLNFDNLNIENKCEKLGKNAKKCVRLRQDAKTCERLHKESERSIRKSAKKYEKNANFEKVRKLRKNAKDALKAFINMANDFLK